MSRRSRARPSFKTDWWRIQEEQGIELMLRMNGMTRKDVEIVEFPYPDDWYNKPEMLEPACQTALMASAAFPATMHAWPVNGLVPRGS
jgi:hypothetical protein